MKLLVLLSVVFCVQSSFAGGTGKPLISKYATMGVVAPKYINSKKVVVFPMGDVQITMTKSGVSKSTLKGSLSPETMKKIFACNASVAKANEVKRPNCAGGATTTYYVGEKMVSIRSCGEVHTTQVSCVDSIIKILDQY